MFSMKKSTLFLILLSLILILDVFGYIINSIVYSCYDKLYSNEIADSINTIKNNPNSVVEIKEGSFSLSELYLKKVFVSVAIKYLFSFVITYVFVLQLKKYWAKKEPEV